MSKKPLKTPMKKWNQKMYQYDNGIPIPRIYYRKGTGKKSGRYLVKCGDCKNFLEIYCDGKEDTSLEINGVIASKKEWRNILLPLIGKARNPR